MDGLPDVFNPERRPWIEPDRADPDAVEAVEPLSLGFFVEGAEILQNLVEVLRTDAGQALEGVRVPAGPPYRGFDNGHLLCGDVPWRCRFEAPQA